MTNEQERLLTWLEARLNTLRIAHNVSSTVAKDKRKREINEAYQDAFKQVRDAVASGMFNQEEYTRPTTAKGNAIHPAFFA